MSLGWLGLAIVKGVVGTPGRSPTLDKGDAEALGYVLSGNVAEWWLAEIARTGQPPRA